MCLTASGNLLVCERDNHRVQELTGLGEAEPDGVRAIHSGSLGVVGSAVAMGTFDGSAAAVCVVRVSALCLGAIANFVS